LRNKKALTFLDFLKRSKARFGSKYKYPNPVLFKNTSVKIEIVCNVHGSFFQTPKKHLKSEIGCSKCSRENRFKERRMSTDQFIKKSISVHGDVHDYSKTVYHNIRSFVTIICKIHKVTFRIIASQHLAGRKCPKCTKESRTQGQIKKKKQTIIQEFKDVHGDKYDYCLVEYRGLTKPVKIICKKHGIFEQRVCYHLNGSCCPHCSESRGEKRIASFLSRHEIEFVRQKRFSDCKLKRQLPFDFYLPEQNVCIEYDGEFHFLPIFADNLLETTKRNDLIKTNYCITNKIKLLRISYKENIEKKLNYFLGI
jgi:very-short-patch-repair endonuclease